MKRFLLLATIAITFSLIFAIPGCSSGKKSGSSSSSSGGSGGGGGTGTGGGGTGGTGTGGGGNVGLSHIPLGGSSEGSGGKSPDECFDPITANGSPCHMLVPTTYNDAVPNELMIAISGVEGVVQQTQNLRNMRGMAGIERFIFATLDGRSSSAQDAANVLDYVRENYNIDNDKTYLLSESAGTGAGLSLGFDLRPEYFAAYWADSITHGGTPTKTASELGFAPWGNVGPGGAFAAAQQIVDGMRDAGYRLPDDAPYSGPGAETHGSMTMYLEALKFFDGKSRQ